MIVQPAYAMQSLTEARRLVVEHGWATLATTGADGLHVASMPCLLDRDHDAGGDAEELVLIGHLTRTDPVAQDLLGGSSLVCAFAGPHGYISAAWYETDPFVPTWNYTAVHARGVPEVLDDEAALGVVARTVEHFEAPRAEPWRLEGVPLAYGRRIIRGVVAFRLRTADVLAKAKLSQDKAPEVRDRVVAALEAPGPYASAALADAMRRA